MPNRRQVVTGIGAGLAAATALRGMPAFAQSTPLRIGALISKADAQGQDEMIQPYDQQMRAGLDLAVADINAGGGILGRQVELVVGDDEGSPAPGADAALRLVREEGVEALVSGFIIAIRSFLDRTFKKEGLAIPVVHAMQTEGTYCGKVAHVGSTSLQAIMALRDHLGDPSRQRTFQVADWSPSQRVISQQFYNLVQGGAVGAALVTTPVKGNSPGEYRGMLRWAKDLEAENFWVAIPRPYAVNIVTQAYELGFGADFAYHFLDFSEWQASQLPEGASVWTALPFVSSDPDPAVQDFVARLRRSSGNDLVTHVAFTHYNAVMALKAAMEKADATTGEAVVEALDGLQIETATGPLTLGPGRYPAMPMMVARATRQGLEVVSKVNAEAGTTCT